MIALALGGLVVLPAVVGAVLAATGSRADRVAPVLAIATALAVVGVAAAVRLSPGTGGVPVPGFTLGIAVDGLNGILLPLVAAITVLVLLAATAEGIQPAGRFHGLMLVFLAAVQLTLLADTLPVLLAAWEVMGATSYALIGFRWQDPAAVGGGLVGFTVTRAADLGLYLAAGAAVAGGFTFTDAASAGPWRDVVAVGVVVAALGKAAQLPFSFWLSRAMTGPSTVSALLHSAAMVAMGGYLLLRVESLLRATGWAGPLLIGVGLATAVLLAVVAIAQTDLKQLLAASTASQLGFVVLAAGLGTIAGGTAQLLAHAATKALLFLIAGVWLEWFQARRLRQLSGVARRTTAVGVLATLGAVVLAGLPPFGIWAAKDLVLAAAPVPVLPFALLAVALSAIYSGRIMRVIWAVNPHPRPTRPASVLTLVPLLILAAGAAAVGVLALPPVEAGLARLIGGTPPAPTALLMAGSALLALSGFLLALWREMPSPRLARHWFGLEVLAAALIVRPVQQAAVWADRADAALDRALHAGWRGTVATARRLGAADARLDRAVLGGDGPSRSIAGGAARLAQLALRPQSGRMFDYFAVGVVGVGVLVVVLVVVP